MGLPSLLLAGRLPTPSEAALLAAVLLVVVAVASAAPWLSRRMPARLAERIPGLPGRGGQPLLGLRADPVPDEPQRRRDLAARYRSRLDQLRRWRYGPAWLWAVLTASWAGRAPANPWWLLLVAGGLPLIALHVAEPFRLRRALAELEPDGIPARPDRRP
jgi:hypothetical protein